MITDHLHFSKLYHSNEFGQYKKRGNMGKHGDGSCVSLILVEWFHQKTGEALIFLHRI